MATGGCEKDYLLTLFADNTTQNISPADMRQLIECIYMNFLDIVDIMDNLETYDPQKALSANMGAVLGDKIDTNYNQIQILDSTKADQSSVYTKNEIDTNFYNKTYIDANYYTKNQTYTQTEIDDALAQIQYSLQDLDARVTALENATP